MIVVGKYFYSILFLVQAKWKMYELMGECVAMRFIAFGYAGHLSRLDACTLPQKFISINLPHGYIMLLLKLV
ncbi:MAG: hypothetical protein OHK0023_16060 [Anaerolineae bacterium]